MRSSMAFTSAAAPATDFAEPIRSRAETRSSPRCGARSPSADGVDGDRARRALVALSHPDTYRVTGNAIGADGGEDIVG